MSPEDTPYISGIYNYCDRWCERCRFTDRCLVYAREQQQWERHLLRGEDPDAPETFVQDLEDTLGETVQMLQEMAEEMGVDLDAEMDMDLDAEPPRSDRSAPLRVRTERWFERVAALLRRIREDLPAIGADLASLAAALSDREQVETTEALEGLRDAYELLGRYGMLIAVKTVRALDSRCMAEGDADPAASGFTEDSLGTARLVHECLGKAAAALWRVGEFSRGWQDEALPLAAEAESLRSAFDAEFPGHERFRRPGLDDPSL